MKPKLPPTVAAFSALLSACGASAPSAVVPAPSEPTTSSVRTPSEPATTTPSPAEPPESARTKTTKAIASVIAEPETDAQFRARIVAVGLTEGEYDLNPAWTRVFEAASVVDSAQCSLLLAAAFEEPELQPAAEKRCGKLDVLASKVNAAKTLEERNARLAKACEIELTGSLQPVTPWALLASALIEDELASRADSTAEERSFPQYIRYLCQTNAEVAPQDQ